MAWDGGERRKKMATGYEPQTAFEGYVVAKLEALTDRHDSLQCTAHSNRIRDLETSLANMQGKASLFGAVMGFLAGLISKIFLGAK